MLDILKNFDAASKSVTECGMGESGMESGVTLKTSSASEMAEILRALAGVENKPDMPPMDAPMDMPVKMKLPAPAPEEAEMEDYDNEPEEEFMDMDDVLPSGDDLHRKKDLKAMRVKDPAVETASIKDRLWAALNEKSQHAVSAASLATLHCQKKSKKAQTAKYAGKATSAWAPK